MAISNGLLSYRLMRNVYLSGILVYLAVALAHAQALPPVGHTRFSAEIGSLIASPVQTPFWLRTNQYGTVPLRGSLATLRLGLQRDYLTRPDSVQTSRRHRFGWGYGLHVVLNAGPRPTHDNPAVLLPDAYVKVRYRRLELFGGNRREVYGMGDTLLTSGFIAWSGNALPFPKLQLHTPDFVPLGFTKKLIALRAGYAHGWFANAYIQGSYLHQKYLYGRLGKPHWAVRLYAGLNHQVQWGGRAAYLVGSPLAVGGSLPTSVRDYLSLVTGRYPDAVQNDRFTGFDGENRIGNHVGSYDFALEWNRPSEHWLLYHQHPYEDASGLAFQNVPDGLTGLRFLNRKVTKVPFRVQRLVLEWLSTTNQSGPAFDQSARYQGGDNYFNHSQYIEGWSYRGRTIGTPFIAPRAGFTDVVNAFTGGGYFPNNRVVAWYAGASGVFRQGPTLTARTSYSRNFGTFNQPYPRPFRQFSALLSAQWRLDRQATTQLSATFAFDRGELFPNSMGSLLTIRRVW